MARLRAGFALILTCSCLVPVGQPCRAQGTTSPEIVATASGAATYVPDRASVMLEVRTDAPTPQEAAARNAAEMTRLLDRLRVLRIPSERISTVSFAVTPNLRYEAGTQTLVGYVANNTVTVKFDSIAPLAPTVDAALAAGATGVRSVRFEASAYQRIRREALERAVEAARQDALALATAAGGTLGYLLQVITDPRVTPLEGGVQFAAAAASRLGLSETAITSGEQTLTAYVQTRWAFLKRR